MDIFLEKGTLIKCQQVESLAAPVIGRVLGRLKDTVIVEALHYSTADRLKLKEQEYLLKLKMIQCKIIKIRKITNK